MRHGWATKIKRVAGVKAEARAAKVSLPVDRSISRPPHIDQDVPTRWCRCCCCSSLRCSAFFVQYQRRQISLFGCWDFCICSHCCFYYSYLQCSRRRMPPRRGQNKRRRKAKAPPTTAIYSSYSATKSKCTYWAPFIFVFSWCLCRR